MARFTRFDVRASRVLTPQGTTSGSSVEGKAIPCKAGLDKVKAVLTIEVVPGQSLRCSFCLKPEAEVARIIAGPGSYICNECVARCVEILDEDMLPGDEPQLPSWAAMSDEQVLERLPKLAGVAGQVDSALRQWVGEARRRKLSWARVGTALGMSRQAAWERFTGGV